MDHRLASNLNLSVHHDFEDASHGFQRLNPWLPSYLGMEYVHKLVQIESYGFHISQDFLNRTDLDWLGLKYSPLLL